MGDDDHWPYVGFDRHARFRMDILDALRSFAYTDRSLIREKKGTSQMQMPLGMAKLRDHKQQVLANNPSIHNHRIDGRQPFCPGFCLHIRTMVKSRAGTEGSLRL